MATTTPLRGLALAKAVINQIIKNPESWDQYVAHSECGTVHCFCGWCQVLGGEPPYDIYSDRDAARFLDVPGDHIEWLYDSDRTFNNLYQYVVRWDRDGKPSLLDYNVNKTIYNYQPLI